MNSRAADVASLAKPDIGPPADWVKPHFFDPGALANRPDSSADQHWLLLEQQINAATNETFIHCSRQVMSISGVQNDSTLKVDFNPAFQKLIFHWIRLWRGTNHLDQMNPDKIHVARQERDLEQQIMDGKQTAMVVLDDVRVGDIVDYAYSIKGENPVFDARFSTRFEVQMGDPVERLYARVLWPEQQRVYFKNFGAMLRPAITRTNDLIESVWDLRRVPGLHLEDALPVWCDPEPWVQLTEFKSWQDVNRWALDLFQNQTSPSPELLKYVSEWKKFPSSEQRALAALRFVQDQVRYFGIEIGINAEKPTDPATVFTRRYGDCKDKSLLLVTLLRAMGIEAYPVLVNTQARKTIANWLPAADIFDHCIVVMRISGRNWWVDPTANYQRGSLADHYLPDYGCGLVISPQTTGLTAIPQVTGLPLTSTSEYFDLGSKNGVSELKVVTQAEGRDAEALRELFATTKRSDIEKNFTHFYDKYYPGTQMASPMEIRDNEAENQFQIIEHYTISRAWIKSDNDGKYQCSFYPFPLAAMGQKPVDTLRKFPLAVSFPQHQILRTEISVPATWKYPSEKKEIVDPAFTFRKQTRRVNGRLVIEYDYQSLADCVSPDRVGEYLLHLDAATKCLGDGFLWR